MHYKNIIPGSVESFPETFAPVLSVERDNGEEDGDDSTPSGWDEDQIKFRDKQPKPSGPINMGGGAGLSTGPIKSFKNCAFILITLPAHACYSSTEQLAP